MSFVYKISFSDAEASDKERTFYVPMEKRTFDYISIMDKLIGYLGLIGDKNIYTPAKVEILTEYKDTAKNDFVSDSQGRLCLYTGGVLNIESAGIPRLTMLTDKGLGEISPVGIDTVSAGEEDYLHISFMSKPGIDGIDVADILGVPGDNILLCADYYPNNIGTLNVYGKSIDGSDEIIKYDISPKEKDFIMDLINDRMNEFYRENAEYER